MKLPKHWYGMSTNFFDSIGYGIMMPVLPDLLAQITGDPAVDTAGIARNLTVAYAGMMFLFGPLLGNLSDRYGRRPVLLVCGGLLAFDYLIMATAPTLLVLFVGRVAAGLAGATVSIAYAVAADTSTPQNKALNFSLMSAAFGAGFVLGPALGGLLGTYGPRVPLFVAAALIGVNFLLGVLYFKESLPQALKRPFNLLESNPLSALLNVRKARNALPLLLADFGFSFMFGVYPAVWAYFTRAVAGWGLDQVALSLALYGFGYVMVQALLVPRVVDRLGLKRTFYLGMLFQALSLATLMVLQSGWLIYAMIPVATLSGLAMPTLGTMLSNSMPKDRQGEVQGIAKSLFALASILTPLLTLTAFDLLTGTDAPFQWPGAPFAVAFLAVPAVVWLVFNTPIEEPSQQRNS